MNGGECKPRGVAATQRRESDVEDSSARVVITCTCGQKMKVPAEAKGKRYKCVKCGTLLTVDAPATPTADARGLNAPATGVLKLGAVAAPDRIGQMLIKAGLITTEQLEEALEAQRTRGGKTFENLISLGHLGKDALHEFLSRQPGMATIKLSNYKLERDLVDLIPKDLALREKVLPIDRLGKLLTIAMACPTDSETVEEVQRVTGLKVKAMLCKLDDIEQAVENLYGKGRRSETRDAQLFERILASEPESAGPPQEQPKPVPPQPKEPAPKKELTPAIIRRFVAMAEDPNTSTRELARAAHEETALAEVLLRAVNSGLFGPTERVESAAMAVALMGKEGVAELLKTAFE